MVVCNLHLSPSVIDDHQTRERERETHLGQSRDIKHEILGVSDTLDVNGFRLFIDGCLEGFGIGIINELDVDAIVFERHCNDTGKGQNR